MSWGVVGLDGVAGGRGGVALCVREGGTEEERVVCVGWG